MLRPLSIGIITTLGEDPRERLQLVQQIGLSHIQWSYQPNLDTPAGRAAILGAAKACGLEITTVFCSYEGQSYADIPTVRATVGLVPIATRAQRLEKTREISLCAQNLGVSRIAMHIGFIPENSDDAGYVGLVETTRGLAEELAERGQTLAFETGQETAQTLRRFLLDVNCANLRVNFDPANMILYGNDNPLQAMPLLAQWMDEVHCKDAQWPTEKGQLGQETRLGEGEVNVKQWIAALLELGFRGPLTIEREIGGKQQSEDVAAAKLLLESLLSGDGFAQ